MRWLMLAVGTLAMVAGSTFQYGLAYLIPAFRDEGLSLEQTGFLVACPTVGVTLTLIAWGAAADRWGERVVLSTGLGSAGVVLVAAHWVHGPAGLAFCLVLAGAATASVLASGRLILGWFARHERGLAMGIRQSAGPMGLALAAATLPALAAGGTAAPLWFLAALFLAAATVALVCVRDPAERPTTGELAPDGGSPYRDASLWRIHVASALLVIPQFTITTFALVFLTDARGWSPLAAGHLLAGAQLCGAVSRLAAGWWSDRIDSRLKPMRIIAITTGVGMLALAAAAAAGSGLAVPLLLFLGVVAVSSNGLSFTAVAEHAGSAWAGRALGIQTTGQNVLTAATPPVLAAAIGAVSFGPSFALVAAFPLVAALLVPVAAERAPSDVAEPAPETVVTASSQGPGDQNH
ncbi:MFS transporter [Asanoa sp. WMMD1127]|uniref:MFS transporter n=1 Tax=Asanoa sp. WMMD1127 TaxID=3016107 RepID=UPI002417689D|nr:MFS transporter [Asanoa sp. WMMD1127]MDG4827423.1 MFS transporter [Asanoa sp. WMMD1127]